MTYSEWGDYRNYETHCIGLVLENTQELVEKIKLLAKPKGGQVDSSQLESLKYHRDMRSELNSFAENGADASNVDWVLLAKHWTKTIQELIAEGNFSVDNYTPLRAPAMQPAERLANTPKPIPLPLIERVIAHLRAIRFGGDNDEIVYLAGQAQADEYRMIKSMFEVMGGKWDKKSQTHVFKESPMDAISNIIETGHFQKTKVYNFGYFPTPRPLVESIIQDLEYWQGMTILEPEIGQGHIADVVMETYPGAVLTGFEINPENYAISSLKHDVRLGDFLEVEPAELYDAVIQNPPFEKQQDIIHFEHALKFLKPGGQMIAIMSPSFTFRTDKRSVAFRALLEEMGAVIEKNPSGSFKSSGTMVDTVTIKMTKPEPELRLRMA